MSSEQQQTNKAAPILCKMGCGFFGSEATGSCCSKCWMESMKKKGDAAAVKAATTPVVCEPASEQAQVEEVATPQLVEETSTPEPAASETCSVSTTAATATTTNTTTTTKKKKKKTSYKKMMAGMMNQSSSAAGKAEKERAALSKGLGGGAFSKIDKI